MVITALAALFLTAAGVSAAAAVVLFFALNIPKCLRMVSGGRRDTGRKAMNTAKTVKPERRMESKTLVLKSGETTVLLARENGSVQQADI